MSEDKKAEEKTESTTTKVEAPVVADGETITPAIVPATTEVTKTETTKREESKKD